jgi:UDP-2-acetamido-3-amino-2,3-dideoxy-glucuronate N-acetyltransferase
MANPEMIDMPAEGGGTWHLHESSYVDDGASVGAGTKIWHFSHVMGGARIGSNCSLGQNVNVGGHAILGNGVKVQNNVSIYDDVLIEDDVFCGPSCVFTNVINPRAFVERKHEYKKTFVKKGAAIGANATIVCGVTLGEYSFVGAGSVVTKDVPSYAIVYGNPARQRGWVCACGGKLNDLLYCPSCRITYVKCDEGLVREIQ